MNDWLKATNTQDPEETTATSQVEQFTPKRLTRKQKAFVDEYIANPKKSATEAAAKVYDVANRNSAAVLAHENLRKPNIIMALGAHAELFEGAIVGVVSDWKDSPAPRKREIALDAAKFGHDKIFGKSTVKIEQQTSVVQIAINLTGDGEQPPDDILDLRTSPVIDV